MEKTIFSNLKTLFRRYRWQFIKSFLLLLTSNLLLVLLPLLFRQAVTALDAHVPPAIGFLPDLLHPLFGTTFHSLFPWVILLLSISFVSALLKYWMRTEFIQISRDAERDVRDQLFHRIQQQSRAFFDRHGIGGLLSRLTIDISAYRELLGPGIIYPLFFFTLVIPGMIALFSISPPLMLLSLIPLIFIPLLNGVVRKKIYQASQAVQAMLGEMNNRVQEHYSAIRVIKSYCIEKALDKRFSVLCSSFAVISFRLACLQGLLFPLFSLLTKIVTVSLVLLAGLLILQAWSTLNVADFISFMWLQSYIYLPVLMLVWVLPIYERGRAAYTRLVALYEEPIEVHVNPAAHLRIPPQADIEFRNLTFSYPNSPSPALINLNLNIKGGTFVGITGPVGAGKTTLFRLLNREYEIPAGTLLIGGRDIHDYSLESFRSEMVTVEQTSFLFSRSVAENVRVGREAATQQELETVARYADLHDTIMGFPEHYDTIVGERGILLSGGQKQRVAMARAFLVNRSIFLLDEIFSAVDFATEERIFAAIRSHFSGRTVLLITHRVTILEQLDQIVYMQGGQVQEMGTPEELRKQKGLYAELVELQRLALGEHL